MKRRGAGALSIVALGVVVTSCALDDYDGSYTGGPARGARQTIDTNVGGAVRTSDGIFEIAFPPHALDASAVVEINELSDRTSGIPYFDVTTTANLVHPAVIQITTNVAASSTDREIFLSVSDVGDGGTATLLPVTLMGGSGIGAVTTRLGRFFPGQLPVVESFAACGAGCDDKCWTPCQPLCGGGAPCACNSGQNGSPTGPSFEGCYRSCAPQSASACGPCIEQCCTANNGRAVANANASSGSLGCTCKNGGTPATECFRACIDKNQGPSCAPAAGVPANGAAPTPGTAICGTGTSATACATPARGGGGCCLTGTSCVPQNGGCTTARACEESSDCAAGAVCCAGAGGASACGPSCAGAPQFCRVASECSSGNCVPLTTSTPACKNLGTCDGVRPSGCAP